MEVRISEYKTALSGVSKLEQILDRALKVAEKAEVFQVTSRNTPVKFEANRLKQIQTKETTGTALRLIKNGHIGFAQASGKIDPDELVNMALETSAFGMEARFEFPAPGKYPDVQIFDPEVDKIKLDDMVQVCQQLIDTTRKHTPDVVCEAHTGKGITIARIINSSGSDTSYTKSYTSLGIEGVIVKDDEMLFVGDGISSCNPIRDFKPVADEVLLQLEMADKKAAISAGTMPVIFKPQGVASALISPLISAFNGKTVFNGASPLKDKLGQKIFDKKFSVTDDASIDYQVSSCPWDDEGVPVRSTALVHDGVVANFYYDLQTAGLAGTKSTGNASRSGGLPSPAPNSLIIGNGGISFDDMMSDIKQGLLIYFLMGAEQGNILNGDFSGNVLLGYKIENGKVTGRVKDTMVSGNIYNLLKDIKALGNDARWIDGMLKTPSIYCSGIPVATKGS
jgi:PmbA protein